MEAKENRFNKEPRLCVVRRLEGMIESAVWVKGKRAGSQLVVSMQMATGLFGERGQ